MSAIARQVLALVCLIVVVFAAGYGTGLYFAPQLASDEDDHDHAAAAASDQENDAHDHGDEGEHVALTKQAFNNLGLKMEKIAPRDYWKSEAVPGEVVEIPGQSRLKVSAPVTGVIESVFVRTGQSASPSAPLFTLRITDEYLAAAQSKWLAGIARREIIEKEIARLAPLTSTGAVAGRRKRDLEYELAQLEASQLVLRQDMLSRGLPEYLIATIAEGRSLASTLEITVPADNSEVLARPNGIRPVSFEKAAGPMDYSIEDILVYAGQTVQRGDVLCTLDHHAELYIRGQAFDSDVPLLNQLSKKGWRVAAEFGHDHDDPDEKTVVRRELPLLRIDNVVGAESQTFTFFLPLKNEVSQTLSDEAGREFIHWRFKPGQRVHLRIPAEKWQDQMVLPLDAVVIEGPNASVFVEHAAAQTAQDHSHDGHSRGDDGHEHEDEQAQQHNAEDQHVHPSDGVFVELEPVPVQILHRDERFVVIANDGQIPMDRRVALNSAYELQQAMKMEAGGGGQPHPHEH